MKKKQNLSQKNIPRTQTTRLASFGPILVIANPACYVKGPVLAFVGRCWVLWAFVGLRWPSMGCCGPVLAFRGCLWARVGLRWPLLGAVGLCGPALAFHGLLWACVGLPWAAVGLRWPSVGCCGPALAFRGLLWACVGLPWAAVGLRWPALGAGGLRGAGLGLRGRLW